MNQLYFVFVVIMSLVHTKKLHGCGPVNPFVFFWFHPFFSRRLGISERRGCTGLSAGCLWIWTLRARGLTLWIRFRGVLGGSGLGYVGNKHGYRCCSRFLGKLGPLPNGRNLWLVNVIANYLLSGMILQVMMQLSPLGVAK